MDKICKNCHWYKPDSEYSDSVNCLEIFEKVKESDTCDSFCENGKYVPTGIWAGFADLVKAVAEKVEEDERV